MANDRYGDIKIVIDGPKAKWMYDVIVNSRTYKEFPDSLRLNYRDNILQIQESWWGYSLFTDMVLPFLMGDDYYFIQYLGNEEVWECNDDEGKCFKRGAFYHGIRVPELEQEYNEKRINHEEYYSRRKEQEAELMKDFYTLSDEEQIEFCMAHKENIVFTLYEVIDGKLKLTHYDE